MLDLLTTWREELALVLGLAGCVLILVFVDRWAALLRRRLARSRGAHGPGATPLCPLPANSYGEARPKSASCRCGGRLDPVFHGLAPSPDRKLWFVIQVCSRCQRRTQTYYDVTGVMG